MSAWLLYSEVSTWFLCHVFLRLIKYFLFIVLAFEGILVSLLLLYTVVWLLLKLLS